ncbi:Filamin A-interacting protein 1-like, partial [Bienertia sinuspersici]
VSMSTVFDNVTIRFWHGGGFKTVGNNDMVYKGGVGRNFVVDPDELCYWDLVEFGRKCGHDNVQGMYYLVPGMSLENGLRKIIGDEEVLQMGEIAVKYRAVEAYLLHSEVEPNLSPCEQPIQINRRKKLTPKKGPHTKLGAKLPSVKFVSTELPEIDTNFLDNYEREDNRAESPLKWSELIGSAGESSEEDDPLYEPEYKKFCEGYEYDDDEEEDDDFEVDDETHTELEDDFSLFDIDLEVELSQEVEKTNYIQPESDESDDELREARDRVKNCNNNILQVALQLHKEACEGKLGDQPQNNQAQSSAITTYQGGGTSDYEGSDEDIDRPTRSEEELEGGNQSEKGELVQADTDFTKFRWKVGQRFANGTEFKDVVSKYAVMQGRDVRDATWLVKKVVNSHTCHRNMNKNRQLKSSWVARKLLEMFKSRPHWPAKEVVETVRRAYRVIVSRNIAYKVKYHAHKMLHGSMKEHYMKVERYIKALELASPETVLQLVVAPQPNKSTPVFNRCFTCFEGVKEGWKAGCRRVICVDAAFLKTFLGGQIMTAVSRDPNDQMFPICWAVVEGENNLSWVWFFTHLQSCLGLGDGSGIAIISDEHQIAKAYNLADFNDAIDELSEMNAEAALAFRRYYLDQLNVDLVARSCSCRKWNMVGIPCCHAIACIYFQNKEAEAFVDDCYKVESYAKAYSDSIPPCEGERYWPRVPCNLDPPPIKAGPGRPRKNRGRPRLQPSTSTPATTATATPIEEPSQIGSSSTPTTTATATPSSAHHTASAQPSQLGRGGRLIVGGQGARSTTLARGPTTSGRGSAAAGSKAVAGNTGGQGRGRGRGKGRGRNQSPIGIGVLFGADGTPQVPRTRGRPKSTTNSSQTSTLDHQQL